MKMLVKWYVWRRDGCHLVLQTECGVNERTRGFEGGVRSHVKNKRA